MKVSRVIRIHNRFLKNRFERCVREATAGGHGSSTLGSNPLAAAAAAVSVGTATRTATATSSPSSTPEEKGRLSEEHQQEQLQPQHQEEGSFGCPPPLPQGSPTGVLDPSPASSSILGGSRQRLHTEDSDGHDAHQGGDEARRGPGLPMDGAVWRSNPVSSAYHESHTCSSGDEDSGKRCPTSIPPDRPGPTDPTGSTNDDVRRSDVVRNSTATTTGGAANPACSENGGRESSCCKTGAHADGGGRRTNKRSSASSPSSSSSLRSLEYLFFTGRRGGTGGVSAGTKRRRPGGEGIDDGGKHSGGAASDEAVDGYSYERWQPDLLKLAEDGFSLPDWSETDTTTEASETASRTEEPSLSGAAWTSDLSSRQGTSDARDGAMEGKSHTASGQGGENPPSPSRSIVLSSHLSEADIPGMSAERATAEAAAEGIRDAAAVRVPSASIGLRSGEPVSPVCRVLVVKVYTGRTRRLPHVQSSGDGNEGRGGSGTVGGGPRPGVLRQAWVTGYKSVCFGGEDGVGEGAGLRKRGEEGSSSRHKKVPSRCQVGCLAVFPCAACDAP